MRPRMNALRSSVFPLFVLLVGSFACQTQTIFPVFEHDNKDSDTITATDVAAPLDSAPSSDAADATVPKDTAVPDSTQPELPEEDTQ